HSGFDDVERLPAAEHVCRGGHILGVAYAGAVLVNADRIAVEGDEIGIIGLCVAWHSFPKMAALEELETRAVDVDRFERVDEAEEFRAAGTEKLAHLLDEGEYRRSHHDVINDIGILRDLREIARERGLRRRYRHLGDDLASLRLDRRLEEVAMVVAEGVVGINESDFLP